MPRILVVEDSRLSRRIIVSALQEGGYETLEAENGEVGLEMFQEHRPDCVLTDLLMPVMEGQTLLAHIRDLDAEVPVIVASADIQQSSKDACQTLGISGFLNKPVKPVDLCNCVEAALSQSVGVGPDEVK